MLLEIWRENPVANSSLQKAFLSIVVSTAYSSSKCLIRGCSLITLYTKVPFLLDWNGVNTKHTNLEIGTFFCCCWLGFFLLSLSRPPLGGCFFVRVGVCARLVGFFVVCFCCFAFLTLSVVLLSIFWLCKDCFSIAVLLSAVLFLKMLLCLSALVLRNFRTVFCSS